MQCILHMPSCACRSLRHRQRSASSTAVRGLLGSRSFQPRHTSCAGGDWADDGCALMRPSGIADAAFISESLLRESALAASAFNSCFSNDLPLDGEAEGECEGSGSPAATARPGSKSVLLPPSPSKSCTGGALEMQQSGSGSARPKRLQRTRTSI